MTAPLPEITLTDEDRDRVRDVVCDVLDIEPGDLTPNGSFIEHYGADSMSLVALSASLERAFDVEIEDARAILMVDLDNACAVVGEALATSG